MLASSSLPYLDTELDNPETRERVRQMIEQEMRSFRPARDYVAHITVPEHSLENTYLLQSEMLRVSEGQPMPPLDQSRLQMDAPTHGRQHDPQAWQQAISNAQSQLEHQASRLDNLELLQRFGPHAWKAHLTHLEAIVRRVEREHAELTSRTELVNRKRKYEQLEAAKRLRLLESEWLEGAQKNRMIEAAIARVQSAHAALESREPQQ